MASPRALRVGVLTLAKHREDVWVVGLVEALNRSSAISSVAVFDVEAATLDVEGNPALPVDVLVNRVSDAASPPLAKATLMFLAAAEAQGLRVYNGSRAYTAGMSKAMHHIMLRRAGLATPRTVVCRSLQDVSPEALQSLNFPLLLKPNSGGFGAGIRRFDDSASLRTAGAQGEVELGEERVLLAQEFVEPADGAVYRVWVCGGRVQCAVRVVNSGIHGACMASVCQRLGSTGGRNAADLPRVEAWQPPAEVADGVRRVMDACGADFGSVEMLLSSRSSATDSSQSSSVSAGDGTDNLEWLYFDVNMLSTLPDPRTVDDPQGLWPEGRDLWQEMASHVASHQC